MCRFLLLHTPEDFNPTALFQSFADICHKSHSVDGEGQRDGWGMAWLQSNGTWAVRKSLHPIWEDADQLVTVPRTRSYALHARSSSFEKDRNELSYNQPYVDGPIAFAFNGLLRGIKLPYTVKGAIGAQRIWNVLQSELRTRSVEQALDATVDLLVSSARDVLACNIGLIDSTAIYAACRYTRDHAYYQLRYHADASLRMICSEPLPGYKFSDVPREGVLIL